MELKLHLLFLIQQGNGDILNNTLYNQSFFNAFFFAVQFSILIH